MNRTLRSALYGILALFAALFVVSSFFLRAEYNYGVYGDTAHIAGQKLAVYIPVLAALLALAWALYRLCMKLDRFPPKVVIPAALAASFAVQTAIVFLFPLQPTADSKTVLTLAQNMLYDRDYSSFEVGGYLYMFPFNFSITLYLKTLLALFPDNYLVLKLFNMLFTLVTTLMVYLIYRQLNGRQESRDYGVLALAAFYPPSLFMVNYIYNDVIATALLTSAVYFLLRFVGGGSWRHLLASAVLLAMGNYFRSIGALVLIAAVLYLLLSLARLGLRRGLIAIALLAALFPLPGWGQDKLLQATGIAEESTSLNSAPVFMWLNMGLNTETLGFWDERESYNIYQRQAGYNKEISTELFKEEIKRKWSEATAAELAETYYKKIIWTWTEGTYQLERYGIGNDGTTGRKPLAADYSYSTFATDKVKSDSPYATGLLWAAYGMNAIGFAFILVRLIGSIKRNRKDDVLLALIVLGFIGFYLLWEIKSRYVYPVYPLLLILAYAGFGDAYRRVFDKRRERHEG